VVSVSGITDLCDTALWADPVIVYDIRALTDDSVPAHWASASPVTWLDAGDPPTLLVHGAADNLVPVSQLFRLNQRSDATGATEQLVIFPGEDHYFSYEAFVNTVEATDLFLRERFPDR
jgi:dipeptidyl aminopeptidase/acylaminoacyl peptidase